MKEHLTTFETSKLSKEKGFDWKVLGHYRDEGGLYVKELIYGSSPYNMNCEKEQSLWSCKLYSAPPQSLLQKWLRDVHDLDVESKLANQNFKKSYYFGIYVYNGEFRDQISQTNIRYNTYEEALEVGLLEALKLIKKKNEKTVS